MERRAHVAKPFWEVFAKFQHPDGSFEAHHETDKFWEKAEAEAGRAQRSARKVQLVRAGIKEIDGSRLLNDEVEIP